MKSSKGHLKHTLEASDTLVSATEKGSSSKAEKMSMPSSTKAEKSTASAKAEKVAAVSIEGLTPSAADAVAKSAISTKSSKGFGKESSAKAEKV